MSQYNAKMSKQRGEKTISDMSPEGRKLLFNLNGAVRVNYVNGFAVGSLERVLDRTDSRKHYKMPPALARLLDIQTVDLQGAHQTDPPIVLATVSETVEKVDGCARRAHITPQQLGKHIRELLDYENEAV